MNILIVEDDPDILKLFTIALRNEQNIIIPVTSAEKALDLLSGKDFIIDLIITDYNLEKLNGVELIKRTKEIENSVKKFIIISSMVDISQDIENLIKNENNVVAEKKPITISKLRELIFSI